MPEITPNLWFDTQAEEAAAFYVNIFPNSRITLVTHYTEAGPRPAGAGSFPAGSPSPPGTDTPSAIAAPRLSRPAC